MKLFNNVGCLIDKTDYHKIAIIDKVSAGGRYTTFKELDQLSDGFAQTLTTLNISQDENIGLYSDSCLEFVVAYLGILKYGATAVLINAKVTKEEYNYIIHNSDVKHCFTSTSFILNYGKFDPINPTEKHKAICIYTSGSTGTPKGVLHTHKSHIENIVRNSKRRYVYGKNTHQTHLIPTPIYHMNGLMNLEVNLTTGHTTVLIEKFNSDDCLSSIHKYKVNNISTVTPVMMTLVNNEKITDIDTTSVKTIRVGSSVTTLSHITKIKKYFKNATIVNAYGSTELGSGIFTSHPSGLKTPELSVGYPQSDIQYRIVNGILQVKSDFLMAEYKNKPELYDACFTEDGYYITGDLFHVDDNGFYYCDGRDDDMFKSGGNTIYLNEIDDVICSNKHVVSCVTLKVSDDIKSYIPVSFVVTKLNTDEIYTYISDKLSTYKIPKIIVLTEIPLNGNGKVDKKLLLEML